MKGDIIRIHEQDITIAEEIFQNKFGIKIGERAQQGKIIKATLFGNRGDLELIERSGHIDKTNRRFVKSPPKPSMPRIFL